MESLSQLSTAYNVRSNARTLWRLARTSLSTVFALVVIAYFLFASSVSYAQNSSSYQSAYAAPTGSKVGGAGISQYQNADRAAAYQYQAAQATNASAAVPSLSASATQPSPSVQYANSLAQGSNVPAAQASAPIYSSAVAPSLPPEEPKYIRGRYSSRDNNVVSQEELAKKYDFIEEPSYASLPVGSDAFLDAATNDAYARRALRNDEMEATSGLGATRPESKTKGLFGYTVETNARDGDTFKERWIDPDVGSEGWTQQLLPEGLMYPSYLAGRKEPRLQSIINHTSGYGALWDITLGGRTAIWRNGTTDVVQPEGWEIELEGAALLRLDCERHRNLAATDYRAGVPIVYGTKRWQFKTGYYHVSSHLGDNYLMDKFRPRVHYSRDAIMLGLAVKPVDAVRMYFETDYAFHCGRTTDPLEIQFGLEYSPVKDQNLSNFVACPFFATHGHLYQERDFGGYWATQVGAQWRGKTNQLMRLGAEYFQGGDDLYQFHRTFQRKYGFGFWYDF